MASGFFPMSRKSDEGQKLLAITNQLREISEPIHDAARSGEDGQYDNSTSDGWYCAHLDIARKLIEDCLYD